MSAKLALVLSVLALLLCDSAGAQSADERAAEIAAPATKSKLQNESAVKQLHDLEANETSTSADMVPAAPTPSVTPAPLSKDLMIVSRNSSLSQFLYFKVGDSVARFKVDDTLDEKNLDRVVRSLSSACVKIDIAMADCDESKRGSVTIDKSFFSNVKSSQVTEWSKSISPASSLWKLTCATGAADCFTAGKDAKKFRLTVNREFIAKSRVLAYGFESRGTRRDARSQKKTAATSPKISQKFDKVYVTRSRSVAN